MITSTGQFNQIIGNAMGVALNEVVDKALELLEKTVESVIYGVGGSEWYQRTHEFADQWYTESMALGGAVRGAMINYNPLLMSSSPQDYQHGSPNWGDYRMALSDTIFSGYEVFNSGVFVEARDAWSKFQSELTEGKIRKWFLAAMRRQGLTIS